MGTVPAFAGLPPTTTILFSTTLPHLRIRRARAFATTYLGPPRIKADERGIGTITFGTSRWTRWQLANRPQAGTWAPFVPDLYAIADAPRVAELIGEAQRALPRR